MSSPNIERFRVFLTECFTAAAKEVFVEVEHLVKECYEENERLRGMLRMFVSSDTTESTRGFYQFTGVTGNIKELLPTAITLSDQDTSEPLPKRLKEEQVEVDVNCRPEAGYVQVQVKTEDIVPSVSVQEDSQVEAKRTYCIIDASQLPKESNTDDDSNETLSDMDNNESNVCHSSDSEAEENTIGTKLREMAAFHAGLKNRGIPEKNLQKMMQDKVDQDVVWMMDEETLSKYLPHYGDRVFARNWAGSFSAEAGRNTVTKKKVIQHIRAKMKPPSSDQARTSSSNIIRPRCGFGNKNAARKTRKMELGWMHYQDNCFRQVRRRTGGGTIKVIARKEDTMNKILRDGKEIFFPNGNSSKGRLEDFDFSLCVMGSEVPLEGTLTVGELCDAGHVRTLRLYICSKLRQSEGKDLSGSSAHPGITKNIADRRGPHFNRSFSASVGQVTSNS